MPSGIRSAGGGHAELKVAAYVEPELAECLIERHDTVVRDDAIGKLSEDVLVGNLGNLIAEVALVRESKLSGMATPVLFHDDSGRLLRIRDWICYPDESIGLEPERVGHAFVQDFPIRWDGTERTRRGGWCCSQSYALQKRSSALVERLPYSGSRACHAVKRRNDIYMPGGGDRVSGQ
jgi:hypothetical protein